MPVSSTRPYRSTGIYTPAGTLIIKGFFIHTASLSSWPRLCLTFQGLLHDTLLRLCLGSLLFVLFLAFVCILWQLFFKTKWLGIRRPGLATLVTNERFIDIARGHCRIHRSDGFNAFAFPPCLASGMHLDRSINTRIYNQIF